LKTACFVAYLKTPASKQKYITPTPSFILTIFPSARFIFQRNTADNSSEYRVTINAEREFLDVG
jgi:hypothetical protein